MDNVRAWSTKLPLEHEALLDEGKSIELLVLNGMLILLRDGEGVLHIQWLHQDEIGTSLIGRR